MQFFSWKTIHTVSSWWFQPIWRICSSNWIMSSSRGEHKQYLKTPPSVPLKLLLLYFLEENKKKHHYTFLKLARVKDSWIPSRSSLSSNKFKVILWCLTSISAPFQPSNNYMKIKIKHGTLLKNNMATEKFWWEIPMFSCFSSQWLFLVPLKGGRWHIIPQLAVDTTYIPLIVLAFWGGPICYRSHLLGEPETTIDLVIS